MMVSTALCLLTAGLIGYVRTGFPSRYRRLLGTWAQALTAQGLGWLAYALRGSISDVLSVFVANVLLVWALQRANHAIHLYFDRPLPWKRDAIVLVVALLFLLATVFVVPNFSLRVVGITVLLVWPMVEAILLMLRAGKRPWPVAFRVVATFLAIPVLLLVLRALNQLFGTPIDSIVSVNPWQIALHLLATLAPMATALGFVLMVATRLQEELAEAANTDPLTGLANRRRVEALARPWIDDPQASLNALMIDVDHFKRINDRFGHDAGDEALVWLASHLRVSASNSDLVGRLGGEEFVMLVPGATPAEAAALAERLRATVAAMPMPLAARSDWPLTVSIGVAARVRGDTDVRDLLRRADDAMYAAKRSGRNRVVVAD